MLAQSWVEVPLYPAFLYPTRYLTGIGAQWTVPSPLPVQLEPVLTGSSKSLSPLSSHFRNTSGEAARLLVSLETFLC